MRAVDIWLWACGHSGDLDTHIAGEIWTPTSQDDPDTRPPARHGMPGTSGHFGGTSDTHTVDRERIAHRRRPSCTSAKSTPQHSACANRCRKRVKRRPERITRGGAPWIRHPSFLPTRSVHDLSDPMPREGFNALRQRVSALLPQHRPHRMHAGPLTATGLSIERLRQADDGAPHRKSPRDLRRR